MRVAFAQVSGHGLLLDFRADFDGDPTIWRQNRPLNLYAHIINHAAGQKCRKDWLFASKGACFGVRKNIKICQAGVIGLNCMLI
jgi:hypothetical protein